MPHENAVWKKELKIESSTYNGRCEKGDNETGDEL